MIRPHNEDKRRKKNVFETCKTGDQVITIGGLYQK